LRTSFAYASGTPVEPDPQTARIVESAGIAKVVGLETETQKGRGMTRLRLFETRGVPIAEETTSHRFETPPPGAPYRRSRWPYDVSVVLHAVAVLSVVSVARHLTPPPRPLPARPIQNVTSPFVLPTLAVDKGGHRRASKAQRSKHVPAIAGDVAAAPAPAALGDSRVADTSSIADEEPPKSAFDPLIPDGRASLPGRRGDPSEAGLGNATWNVRGSPTAKSKPGGLGENSIRDVRNDGSLFSVRPGFEGALVGGGATPPRIQEPLPIPDYPVDARTHRLQGVVVLEVMLDTLGKAHVRGVLSRPLGFGIEEAARNAAERLKFTPARQGGRSVDAIVQVRVTFTLTDSSAPAITGGA
jgi:TonB family protein